MRLGAFTRSAARARNGLAKCAAAISLPPAAQAMSSALLGRDLSLLAGEHRATAPQRLEQHRTPDPNVLNLKQAWSYSDCPVAS